MFIDNKTLEEININGDVNHGLIADELLNKFCQEILTPQDKLLLNLAFSPSPSQEDLDKLLLNWDIEAVLGNKNLLLSYFMKRHPDLKFSEYEKPRLKGLLNFFKFHNLKIITHFAKVGKALNAAGIPVMILKGGAMKYLRPDLPRSMGDIDILVPENHFADVANISKTLGYEFYEPNIQESNAIDLHLPGSDEGTVDIHKYIYMGTGKERNWTRSLFSRASEEKIFGVDALIPSTEDLFFLALINLAKNLREKTSSSGILFTLFDCKFWLESKPDFDWAIVIGNAKKTHTSVQMSFAIEFMNKIVPGLLPEKIVKDKFFQKEMENYCKLVMFKRFFFPDFQEKSREIKLFDAVKSPGGFIEYMKIKPKYYFLKQIKGYPLFIKMFYDFVV